VAAVSLLDANAEVGRTGKCVCSVCGMRARWWAGKVSVEGEGDAVATAVQVRSEA